MHEESLVRLPSILCGRRVVKKRLMLKPLCFCNLNPINSFKSRKLYQSDHPIDFVDKKNKKGHCNNIFWKPVLFFIFFPETLQGS